MDLILLCNCSRINIFLRKYFCYIFDQFFLQCKTKTLLIDHLQQILKSQHHDNKKNIMKYRFLFLLQQLYSEDSTIGQRPQWATMTSPYVSFEAKVVDKNKRNISPTRNNANSTHTFSPIKSGSRPVTARSERDPPSKYFSFCLSLGCNIQFHLQEVVAIFECVHKT